jgi:alpha-tubulin suppressor-like RCC1 family protein
VIPITATSAGGYHFVNWTGDVGTIANVSTASTAITVNDNYSITANFAFQCLPMVDGGHLHTAGLKSDGIVVAAGLNNYGQCNVGNWTDIVQVSAGFGYIVGLKSGGTVVAAGSNDSRQCDVGGWA